VNFFKTDSDIGGQIPEGVIHDLEAQGPTDVHRRRSIAATT
jgi:hypothetical protein